jgi:glycosyltransferase involved in cell wall biosynthesis
VKYLLLAPNAGVSLSTGGGSNFVVKQAKALARAGHEVVMAGYHALPRDDLERLHGVSLVGVRDRIRVVSGGGGWEFQAHRALPGKPSPYFALFDPRVGRWIADLGATIRPDAAWFHDDIPIAAAWARTVPSHLYVHYPLLARSASVAPPLRRTRGRGEAAQDAVLRRAAGRIVFRKPTEVADRVYTNSRVTSTACTTVWGARSTVLPTYVPAADAPEGPRAPEALSVAAFHRGKGLDVLIAAFSAVACPDASLTLIGHPRDAGHLSALQRTAARDRRPGRIRFRVDASRTELTSALERAEVLVNPSEFEPFGLAVLEGMSYGAHPVVRRSEFSGAWTDLLREGRDGDGFATVPELTEILERRLSAPSGGPDPTALGRALNYSEQQFQAAMVEASA